MLPKVAGRCCSRALRCFSKPQVRSLTQHSSSAGCRSGSSEVSRALLAVAAGAGAVSLVMFPRPDVQCWSLWGGSYDIGVEKGKEATLLSQAPILNKAVAPEDVDMVLFHGGCPDGFAAAFAAFLSRGEKCEYVGIGHGANKRPPANIDGKTIAILDFSFDHKTMEDMLRRAKGVIVLDHHASAQEELAKLPDRNKVFEMKQSGATLAWDFFHGKTRPQIPLLFRYIEDFDIWRFTLRRSKAFTVMQELEMPIPPPGAITNPKESFAPWKRIYDGGDCALDAMISKGVSIVDYQEQLVDKMARGARVRRLKLAPEHKAYVVDASCLPSELGNKMALNGIEKGISYAMVVSYKPDSKGGKGVWTVALRSLYGSDSRAADVSLIAKKYGGGGHRAASGARFEVQDLEAMFVAEADSKL